MEKMAGTTAVALFLVMFAETAIACEKRPVLYRTHVLPFIVTATAIPVYITFYNIDHHFYIPTECITIEHAFL